jgi:hypothetical protein
LQQAYAADLDHPPRQQRPSRPAGRQRQRRGALRLASQSGLLVPAPVLSVMSAFLLVVIAGTIAGDSVAGDAAWGDLRYLLMRPVPLRAPAGGQGRGRRCAELGLPHPGQPGRRGRVDRPVRRTSSRLSRRGSLRRRPPPPRGRPAAPRRHRHGLRRLRLHRPARPGHAVLNTHEHRHQRHRAPPWGCTSSRQYSTASASRA